MLFSRVESANQKKQIMKLKKVRIRNYRSVTATDLPIDSNLTTLVGANEHGKTNLLWSIRLLDFKTAIKESGKRMPKSGSQPEEPRVIFEFELNQRDREAIAREPRVLDAIAPEAIAKVIEGTVDQAIAEAIAEAVEILSPVTLEIAYKDGETNLYTILNKGLSEDLKGAIIIYLKSSLEKNIFYFDTFEDKLKHRIEKSEIVNKSNDITNGLMKLASLQGKENTIFQDNPTARRSLLEGGRQLTDQLKSLWVQGKEDNIEVRLTVSNGNFLNVDIEDSNTYGDVSTRSRGFLFFLSFILKFKEYHDGDLKEFVFLIDEPGIFLHPRGQKDLLLYLEDLSEFNQLIYTTHSPFMINRLNNFRVRVISKDKEVGTQVDVKPYIHNWKSLRTSLGMMLNDSFYYADNTLIVEGPADRLYLITLLEFFHKEEIIKSDLNILSIIDSGGASNVPTMVQMVKFEERPLVVFTDSDTQGDNAKKAVLKRGVGDGEIKQVGNFRNGAITTEDLLPRKYLNKAINLYISELVDEDLLEKPEKEFAFEGDGVVDELKKHLGGTEISKLNIARHFDEIVSKIQSDEFKRKEFADIEKVIEWVSNLLEIRVEKE